MKIPKISLLSILFVLFAQTSYALGWIQLHERADKLTSSQAQEKLTKNPDALEDIYILGLVYLNEYKTQDAKDSFQRILQKEKDNILAEWGMAEILRREHQYAKSIPVLEQIIKQRRDFAPAYITLAYIRYIQMDFNGSSALTGQVINMGQGHVDAANFLRSHGLYAAAKGMLAHYGGPLSKAINGAGVLRHLNIIQKLAPDSAVVNFGLGSYYLLIPRVFGQNLDKAAGYLKKTISAEPLFPDPYVRLAQIYKQQGDLGKYDELISKALELDPESELALDIKHNTCAFICLEGVNQDN